MRDIDNEVPDRTHGPAGGHIVVGVDDSRAGLTALRRAVDLARTANSQLVAVRTWALGQPRHGGRRRHQAREHTRVILYFDGNQQRDASAKLVRDAFRTAMGGVPEDVKVTIETPEGDPAAVLTNMAADGDILVVGTERGQSMKRLVHGSVSRYCCAHSQCPVVVVPAGVVPAGTDRESGATR